MTAQIVNKISLKTIKAQPKPHSFVEGKGDDAKILPPRQLATIYGVASGYTIKQTAYGDSFQFNGSFEAVNIETGEVFKSGRVFVPGPLTSLFVGALDTADGKPIEFALEIIGKHADNDYGYGFDVKPLIELREADNLSKLREVSRKALPDPVKAAPAKAKRGAAASE